METEGERERESRVEHSHWHFVPFGVLLWQYGIKAAGIRIWDLEWSTLRERTERKEAMAMRPVR